MKNKDFILKGVIESYCLGLLTSDAAAAIELKASKNNSVKKEINDFMLQLEQYAFANPVDPGISLKSSIFKLFENLKKEESKDIHNLPLINKHSNHKNWLQIVKPLLPAKLEEPIFIHELRNDDNLSQTLIWLNVDFPDEVHADEQESFIILAGKCRCYIQGKVVELEAGGYLEIPLQKHHHVEMIETVLAVVQRIKVA